MQYRRCTHSGLAISAVRLRLSAHGFRKNSTDVRALVERALEHGINAFQIDSADIGFLHQVSQVLKLVDRSVLFISLTARDDLGAAHTGPIASQALRHRLAEAVRLPGLQRLDMVTFQSAEFRALSPTTTPSCAAWARRTWLARSACRSSRPISSTCWTPAIRPPS